jgi:hypothetical protein
MFSETSGIVAVDSDSELDCVKNSELACFQIELGDVSC